MSKEIANNFNLKYKYYQNHKSRQKITIFNKTKKKKNKNCTNKIKINKKMRINEYERFLKLMSTNIKRKKKIEKNTL